MNIEFAISGDILHDIEIEVDLAAVEDETMKALCLTVPMLRQRLPTIIVKRSVPFDLKKLTNEQILEEVENRDLDSVTPGAIERTYRYLAEGDVASAMDELHREFGLDTPWHARKVVERIAPPLPF